MLRPDFDRFATDDALWTSCDQPDDARDALARSVRDAVAHALTDKQREAVEMHFFEGLSQGDIARRLGVTQQVVQKRIYGAVRDGHPIGGALARLRDALAGTR